MVVIADPDIGHLNSALSFAATSSEHESVESVIDVNGAHTDSIYRQRFANLLSNALKYKDKAVKRVEVGYAEANDTLARVTFLSETHQQTVYYLRDNSIGIAARRFNQIVKMFKRLHGRVAYDGGSGAGLTIVRKLVGRHGGHVWFELVQEEGCTFFFTLGRADAS